MTTVLNLLIFQGLKKLVGVVWCILPSLDHRDPKLARQAKFINMLKPGEIWSNVLLVCKESTRPERDATEAVKMARERSQGAQPKVIGHRYHSADFFIFLLNNLLTKR